MRHYKGKHNRLKARHRKVTRTELGAANLVLTLAMLPLLLGLVVIK